MSFNILLQYYYFIFHISFQQIGDLFILVAHKDH